MAQIFTVPVEFKFAIRCSEWTVGSARATSSNAPEVIRKLFKRKGRVIVPPERQLEVTSPERFAGLTLTVPAAKLPSQESHDVLLGIYKRLPPPTNKIDPWAARSDFLKLDGCANALAGFLNRYGDWKSSSRLESANGTSVFVVLPWEVWQCQQELRQALRAGGAAWFAGVGRGQGVGLYHLRPEFPHLYRQDMFCWDAIKTATTIDFLRRVKFRICRRVDCRESFVVERKGKLYCSQYCGHIVSVRRMRKKEQAEANRRAHAQS